MKKIFALAVVLAFFTANLNGQKLSDLKYIFSADSLKGFDEAAVQQEALQRGFFGREYKVFMYRAKRSFINSKYGYYNPYTTAARLRPATVQTAPCTNIDFESSPSGTISAISGWTITEGQNGGSCLQIGCCPTATAADAWIRTTPYAGPAPLTLVPNSPLGGTQVIQLNDDVVNAGEVVRIEQTFAVTAGNALFQYAYIAALNGSAHACCDQPYFTVQFYDCSLNMIPCGTTSIVIPGTSCTSTVSSTWTTTSSSSGISYMTAWETKSVDLSAYIGSCVTIRVTTGDCDGWAHAGWAYFDAKCSPFGMNINSIPLTASGYTTCANTVTLSVPPGISPVWDGPTGSGVTSNTNTSITTGYGGTYTLTTNMPGFCVPSTQTVNLIFANGQPSVAASSSLICAGNTVSLTAMGIGLTSYTWSTGSNMQTIIASPTTTTIYSVSVTNSVGCVASTADTITVAVCTGVEQMSSAGVVSVYPNPNNGTFIIQSAMEETVTIMNELGQLIQTIRLTPQNKFRFNVTGLSPGIYFVISKNLRQKIIVQR